MDAPPWRTYLGYYSAESQTLSDHGRLPNAQALPTHTLQMSTRGFRSSVTFSHILGSGAHLTKRIVLILIYCTPRTTMCEQQSLEPAAFTVARESDHPITLACYPCGDSESNGTKHLGWMLNDTSGATAVATLSGN